MIVESYSDIPYGTCEVARIYPKGKNKFSGTLEVNGVSYAIFITRDKKQGEQDRVWARVIINDGIADGAIDEYALAVAEKALTDNQWDYVKVDLCNGETAYTRTWTCNFPDDAGMDSFLADAADFIDRYVGELHGFEPRSRSGIRFVADEDFDFSLL